MQNKITLGSKTKLEEVFNKVKPKNFVDVITSKSPTIVSSIKEHGLERVNMVMAGFVVKINESFNVKTQMTERQVMETAEMLSDLFRVFKLDDVVLWYKKASEGDYGQPYDRLDKAIIKKWAMMYIDERLESGANMSIRESQTHKDVGSRIKQIESLTDKFKL